MVQRRTTCIMTTKESPRLQTASAAFLCKQSKNTVIPFVLATLSRKVHRFGGGGGVGGGGALDPLVLFPDNVSETVLHLAASTQGPERSAAFVTQSPPFPLVHQQIGIIQQPEDLIYNKNCRLFPCCHWNFTSFVRI